MKITKHLHNQVRGNDKMKTLISITVFFIILGVSISDAQFIRAYGIKAGYVKAEQRYNYIPRFSFLAGDSHPIWGFDAGAFVELFDFPNFSLLTEVNYIQKGRTITVWATAVDKNSSQGYIDLGQREEKQRFDYISIPVLAKLRIDGPTLTPFITAGPSFEYLISFPSSDMYDKFKKSEFAFVFSAGVELSLGVTPKLSVECRYSLPLTNSYKNENVTIDNRILEFLLGVAF
jgi:hypothetical protein